MFWTVWDTNDAKVERATLAGENRTTLWSLGKENSGWPNGLTIDYLEERIYWAGAKYVVSLNPQFLYRCLTLEGANFI